MNRWPWLRTVLARLTLLHVAAMVLVLVVYASAVFMLVRLNVSNALDDRLRGDFRWAAEMAQQQPDGTLVWFDGDQQFASPWLQVWSDEGQVVFRTALARRLPLPESQQLARDDVNRIVSVATDTVPFRLLTRQVSISGRDLVIQVGWSEAAMRQELRELMLVLVLGLPLSVGAAGVGGYWLARGALAQVDRMTERARTITAERLGERLPVENPDDELGRLASVFNDTLSRLESSFEQMRRFTAHVSHELRTPLTAIRSVGEVGLRRADDPDAYRAVISDMLEDADRLSGLVERLLLLSKGDTGQITLSTETIDLSELTRGVVTHLSVLAEERLQTMTTECRGTCQCVGDRLVLRQALINIVDNAIKYTPEGGQIHLHVLAGPRGAVIEVSDTGPGIPERLQHRIFDRFWRGAPDQFTGTDGAGLGLALAKWAVEANRGELNYTRSTTGGSLFRITLPPVSTTAATASTAAAAEAPDSAVSS